MTHAYAYAIENELPGPAKFERNMQATADYLESVLGATDEHFATGFVLHDILNAFVAHDVLTDHDLEAASPQYIVDVCKEFAYGEVSTIDAYRAMSERYGYKLAEMTIQERAAAFNNVVVAAYDNPADRTAQCVFTQIDTTFAAKEQERDAQRITQGE